MNILRVTAGLIESDETSLRSDDTFRKETSDSEESVAKYLEAVLGTDVTLIEKRNWRDTVKLIEIVDEYIGHRSSVDCG